MLRTLLYIAIGLCGTSAAIVGALELRAREDAQRLTLEAVQVLQTPFRRAPELSKIDATRALKLLEQAISIRREPHREGVLAWATALDEYQKGRLELAERALARAEHALPGTADLETLAAALAMRAGRAQEASTHIAKALARSPRYARARMLASDLAADAGRAQQALDLLRPLIAQEPEVGALYNRCGLAQEALGDLESALSDFERAATLDPSLPQPHINIGRLLREQDRSRDAERAFALAIARAPSEADAWLGRGLSRVALGDLEGGRLDIQQARELGPAQPAPLVALADLDARRGALDAAMQRYRAALALASDDAVTWVKLGNALARRREYAQARESFERAIELQPALAAAHNGLGAALMGQGLRSDAEKAFTTAAELDTRDPNPLLNLALLRKPRAGRPATHNTSSAAPARDPSARLD
jgi:tetratricopeptide (TPR) repeat protein